MESAQKPHPSGITIERIVELFVYDPAGILSRKIDYGKSLAGTVFVGQTILVDGHWIRNTHIIWVLYYGHWPRYWIDHKDRIKAHNNIDNLRDITPTQNQQNKAGYATYSKGVTWRDRKTKPWQAKIRVNGERLHLGSFVTQEEAAEAYRQAAVKYHGEFACLE